MGGAAYCQKVWVSTLIIRNKDAHFGPSFHHTLLLCHCCTRTMHSDVVGHHICGSVDQWVSGEEDEPREVEDHKGEGEQRELVVRKD